MISELESDLHGQVYWQCLMQFLRVSLPSNKMGTYMGIFNFFIVIPQIMAATILGFLVKTLFGGETILALVTGGVSMFHSSNPSHVCERCR